MGKEDIKGLKKGKGRKTESTSQNENKGDSAYSLLVALLIPFLCFSVWFYIRNWNTAEDIEEQRETIEGLSQRITAIESAQSIYMNLNNRDSGIHIKAEGVLADCVMKQDFDDELITIKDSGVIAVGIDGTEYTKEELADKRVLLSYTEEQKEIFFCGQINSLGSWDGECLINVYFDNKLLLASTEVYDNGTRIYYDQLYRREDNSNWIFNSRTTKNQVNIGDTWEYNDDIDIEQIVNNDNISESDLIIPLTIKSEMTNLYSHYHGNTSEGKYEDDTGRAYLVIYFDDAYVKTLYVGRFRNGLFDDSTKNAWYITKDVDTEYMYFKGNFANGKALNDSKNRVKFINPLSKSELKEIVSNSIVLDELKWDEEGLE